MNSLRRKWKLIPLDYPLKKLKGGVKKLEADTIPYTILN